MHETALAKRILDAVIARAQGARVTRVRGVVAEDEALSHEALEFHFTAHARGTLAEGAVLELELRHLSARCVACAQVFLPEHHTPSCPRCGSLETSLAGTPGVFIENIDVEDP
jgi:hydrogenase nickel incorporation protein HypA/HybF